MMRRSLLLGVLSVTLLGSTPVRGQQLGVDFSYYSQWSSGFSDYTLGFFFDVVNPITISRLGYFDHSRNGFINTHTVGIWNSSGTLLTSGVVGSGTSSPLSGWYRMVAIAPLALAPGTGYVVGGFNGMDAWIGTSFSGIGGKITHPDISITGAAFGAAPTFSMPDQSVHDFPPDFYGGGNFEVSAAVVVVTPEPASMILLGTGLVGIMGIARRRWER